jgi:hypothetical protein
VDSDLLEQRDNRCKVKWTHEEVSLAAVLRGTEEEGEYGPKGGGWSASCRSDVSISEKAGWPSTAPYLFRACSGSKV